MILHKWCTQGLLILAFIVTGTTVAMASSVCFQCHEKAAFQKNTTHKPVAEQRCSVCHNPHAAKHKGLLDGPVDELCFSCHKGEGESFQKGFVHQPVRQGNCLVCHTPHASHRKGLLHGKSAESCFTCHEDLPKKYKVTHRPFAKGDCSVCHQPHRAGNIQLLRVENPDSLCFSCHKNEEIGKGHTGFSGTITNCLSCHNPHGSSRAGMVREFLHQSFSDGCQACHAEGKIKDNEETCLVCHEQVRRQLFSSHNHLGISPGNSCTACHSPHAGDSQKLLKGSRMQICRNCHEDTFQRYADLLYRHPKVATGECAQCHFVHGSDRIAMTREDGNKVCSTCHETQGQFSHPVGVGINDPRTGQEMTCNSCHNPMGTDFKGNLVLSGSKDLCVQCHQDK